MTTRTPLSPGAMFLVPRGLFHTTEAPKRDSAPALCFPPLCRGAHGSDPQLVLPAWEGAAGTSGVSYSSTSWSARDRGTITEVPTVQATCPETTAGLVSAQPPDLPYSLLLGWKEVFYDETTKEGGIHRKNRLPSPPHLHQCLVMTWPSTLVSPSSCLGLPFSLRSRRERPVPHSGTQCHARKFPILPIYPLTPILLDWEICFMAVCVCVVVGLFGDEKTKVGAGGFLLSPFGPHCCKPEHREQGLAE